MHERFPGKELKGNGEVEKQANLNWFNNIKVFFLNIGTSNVVHQICLVKKSGFFEKNTKLLKGFIWVDASMMMNDETMLFSDYFFPEKT